MDYIAILVSLLALVGAGFAFLRANSSHNILSKRIETLREKSNAQEARLRKPDNNPNRGNKPVNEVHETGRELGRKNQPRTDIQQEARQNKPRQEQQNEPRQKQQKPEQQQEARQKQPRPEQQEARQKQRERQPQPQQQQQASPLLQPNEDGTQQPQQKRRKENRRRNEPMERAGNNGELEREQQLPVTNSGRLEFAGGDLLDELEQAAGNSTPVAAPVEAPFTGKKYAIIPEDGVIRMHQLQQQPDSDSYIEVDAAPDGSSSTRYRFNLAGNHEFVIAQGIDRLENAFDFEKPSNRMVSKVVQQQDGMLTKVNNGWKIMEKARIDFR